MNIFSKTNTCLKYISIWKFTFTVLFLFYFFKLINLFIFWLCWGPGWVFVAARGLSLIAASGGYSSLQCAGFSLQWLLLLQSTGSRHAGFRRCGTQAQ